MSDWNVELSPILAVSLDQIVRHGYDATSVRKIAGEVGVTVPALYYHFENKQAILMALLDHAMRIVTSHVDAALEKAGSDPAARLSGAVEAIVLYMAHHRDLAFLDSERRSLTPVNLARYVAHRDRIEGLLRDSIADGRRAGTFRTPLSPAACGRAILSMCQGVAGWFQPGGPQTAEEAAADYVRIALAVVQSA
ncbi:TetR family transcriptional regulator [Actinoplanes sp. OR16]|uniref:TetR/AcrR family transcriptional regulator n=1 Tax=Actinoplanes sp. OR16 TaxID=946334 RepID=UPI000F6FCB29|nr:TetR/AcrR family transcriptional regulator [Actinoplanes sp. OR16]BBH68456.1 TetR family transcriptional regulator [Actinoplanes sp. OR16]